MWSPFAGREREDLEERAEEDDTGRTLGGGLMVCDGRRVGREREGRGNSP